MNRNSTITLCLLAFLFSCQNPHPTSESINEEETTSSQDYLIHSTLYAQTSAEYKALCYQAYELAEIQVERALANGTQRPAVVLDLDETVLDNSPYTAWQVQSNNPYTPKTWSAWVEEAIAEAVPGAVEFLTWAHSEGVDIYYISNRNVENLGATIKNLRDLGVPQADSTHIFLKTTTSDKSHRRAKVKAGAANIILYIGDNLGDYSEIWDKPSSPIERSTNVQVHRDEIGVKFIVLPNSLYGTWEGAIYNYDRSINDSQRDSLRRSLLKPWNP